MSLDIQILRLFITFVLALAFGLERQRSHKPVGFGTFIFVAIGSCGLALVALEIAPSNPLPMLAAIVTGIGFLGAGALIKTTDKIFGFTTAASIWLFAILGLTIGVGNYKVGGIVYSVVWTAILIDKYIETKGIGSYRKRISFKIKGLNHQKNIDSFLNKKGIKKYHLMHKKIDKKEKIAEFTYMFDSSGKNLRNFVNEIEKIPYFIEISLD